MNSWIEYDPQFVRRRYDRLASIYPLFEWLFWMPREIRSRAVTKLDLKPGDRVLEVGCGTGRNLSYLSRAVGSTGIVYAVDLSEGMLARAKAMCEKDGLRNVKLLHSDAADFDLPEPVAGAIFSFSYCTMRHRKQVLRHAWQQLKAGGRLVMVDSRVPAGFIGKLTYPFLSLIMKLTVLGNPDLEELKDISELAGPPDVEEMRFGTYFIARSIKP
jgi:demethylmenaquinone methyltransferase/2-methoxy-6-polyprenyl-1,4-benzoquinol methylase